MFFDFSKERVTWFLSVIGLLAAGVAGTYTGISYAEESPYFSGRYAKAQIEYYQYALEFSGGGYANAAARLFSFSTSAEEYAYEAFQPAHSVPVLLYHDIVPVENGEDVTVEKFKNQMALLKEAGWETVTLQEFYRYIKGEMSLPEKSFLLTFDDGAKTSYYPVDPILKALQYTAVSFIIARHSIGENSGTVYYLSEDEIAMMLRSGRWEIQSHGKEDHNLYYDADGTELHFLSNRLTKQNGALETVEEFTERVRTDMAESKHLLEQRLGIRIISFAYPFGDFGQDSINFPEAVSIVPGIVQSVYPMSFYQVWPGNGFSANYPGDGIFWIKRIDIGPRWNAENLLAFMEMAQEKELPYTDGFTMRRGWVVTWGGAMPEDGRMRLYANPDTVGSHIFLNGSYLWTDYSFESTVNMVKGEAFSLIGRYQNNETYVSCSFTPAFVQLEQIINGERKILSRNQADYRLSGIDRHAGMEVRGDTAVCTLDGEISAEASGIDATVRHGGIGFGTWDTVPGNSELIIKNVSVTAL